MTDDIGTHLTSLEMPAELATKFLSLYECLSNPEHTELLIQTIGDWLEEEDNALYIRSLERHAETVRNLVIDVLNEAQNQEYSTRKPTYQTTKHKVTGLELVDVEAQLGVSFVADDVPIYGSWINGQEQSKIFQVVDEKGQGHLCLAAKTKISDSETALKFWLNDPAIAEAAEELLVRDLSISHSECLVLREIALGLRRSEIAEKLGKSNETIRSQIKSIANKMGVSGQIEIAAELRNLETVGIPSVSAAAAKSAIENHIVLPDGRTLEYLEYGPKNGRPILFFHCFLSGKHLPASIDEALAETNFRIISVSRAGYGGSSMHTPLAASVLEANSDDFRAVIATLGLGPCYILANATGFATAFYFAAKYPELTRKILGLDPVPPISRLSDMGKLVGLFKASALTMTKAPATFSLMTKFAMRRLDTFDDATKTYRRHILYPTVKLEKLESPEGIDAGTRNVQDLRVNHLKQWMAEAQAFRSDWSALGPESNRRPEVILFHTKDNPFVTSKGTRELAKLLECEIIQLGDTFPFLEPHLKTMLKRIA